MNMTRREFTKVLGAAGAAMLLPQARVLGANADIRIAALGVGGKGSGNAKMFRKMPGVRLVAIADPDQAKLDKLLKSYSETPELGTPEATTDFRRLLDRQDIDAVCISTPNHWHSLMTIMACQAGKHVYVEKPVSHTLWEGRKLAQAAEKYDCIVQGGTQNRSDVGLLEFYEWFKKGELGKIKSIRGLCYRSRKGIGKQDTPLKPPSSLDYNLWLGPAPDQVLYRPKFHYDWHWYWYTGNGDLGNQGPHEFNLILWTLGDMVLPTRVTSFGGRFGWNDAAETANMQFCIYETKENIPVYFEVRNMQSKPDVRSMPHYRGQRVGIVIDCENGSFLGGRGGGWLHDTNGKRVRQFKGDGGGKHHANFIEAVRQHKTSVLRSPVVTNHISDCWHHMANISYRVGSTISPGELKERMQDDPQGLDAIERYGKQLADWNVDLNKEPWILGASLAVDGRKECFTGPMAQRANKLLHRQDRAPFIVPDTV